MVDRFRLLLVLWEVKSSDSSLSCGHMMWGRTRSNTVTRGRIPGSAFLSKSGSTPCEKFPSSSQLLVGVYLVVARGVHAVKFLRYVRCVLTSRLHVEPCIAAESYCVEVLPVAAQPDVVSGIVA